jgi:hypothetical protein
MARAGVAAHGRFRDPCSMVERSNSRLRSYLRSAVPLSIVIAFGCTSADDNANGAPIAGVAFSDSAGVRIVQNHAPLWRANADGWRIDPEPLMELGHGQHRSDHLVNVRGAVLLESGDIVVHDVGRREAAVTAYSGKTGEEVRIIGRLGQGPGEFFATSDLAVLPGDTIVINTGRSIAFFAADGVFQREILRGQTGHEPAAAWAATGDHSRGFFRRIFPYDSSSFLTIGTPPGREEAVYRIDRDGGNPVLFHPLPGVSPRDYPVRVVTLTQKRPILITRSLAVCGGRMHLAAADESHYSVVSPAGALERIVRFPMSARPIDDETKRAMLAVRKERITELADISHATLFGRGGHRDSLRAIYARWQDSITFPEKFPVFASMVVDSECNVWIQHFVPPHLSVQTVDWTVFDPDGRMLGTVALPDGLRVFEIGGAHVLGRGLDMTDHLPIVSLYRLRKSTN